MRKFEIEHLKSRVSEVVLCTNRTISSILNKTKKGTGLTDSKKYSLIKSGVATVKAKHDLVNIGGGYRDGNAFTELLKCFDYPETESQKEKISFNENVNNSACELHTEVELSGKRLIDRALLGIIEAKDISDELMTLGNMVSLARRK